MKNILVPVDFSDATAQVVATAEKLARAFGAKVWLLHCVAEEEPAGVIGEIPGFISRSNLPLREMHAEEFRQLSDLGTSLRDRGVDTEEVLVSGSAIDRIRGAADQHDADLIVVGSHGHGALYELLVGTVTRAVLQRIGRPTLIVPTGSGLKSRSGAGIARELESAAIE